VDSRSREVVPVPTVIIEAVQSLIK